MAYLSLVTYDDGGRVRSLDGMGAVEYDNGRTRNLLGADLGAVAYDSGGRFRTLVGGLGDDFSDFYDSLPLAPSDTFFPIEYMPPTPSPIVDTTPAEITGSLVPPSSGPVLPPIFYTPLAIADTQSAPIAGKLVDTTPQAVAPPVQTLQIASALTSVFSGIKNIFSSTGSAVQPAGAGKIVGTVAPGTVGASWFSQQSMVGGLPNWGVLAGVGVAGIVLVSMLGSSGGSRRRKNPRRRNGMELILMGANPSRRIH